ncbi:hypothetical protein [Neobacillus novalis]|uniref:hypothetical protein n=1 Tax=Neobacillus novalis TaxID=220687 RepID=UPI00147239FE|nr:hypothetical protein [Neobacillus novalis]
MKRLRKQFRPKIHDSYQILLEERCLCVNVMDQATGKYDMTIMMRRHLRESKITITW